MSNLKYMIWANSEVTDEMIDSAIQTSRDTLRLSVSGTERALLKYNPASGTPPVFDGATTYTHSEILTLLDGTDWVNGVPSA